MCVCATVCMSLKVKAVTSSRWRHEIQIHFLKALFALIVRQKNHPRQHFHIAHVQPFSDPPSARNLSLQHNRVGDGSVRHLAPHGHGDVELRQRHYGRFQNT